MPTSIPTRQRHRWARVSTSARGWGQEGNCDPGERFGDHLKQGGKLSKARSHFGQALQLWKELRSGKFVLGLTDLANLARKQKDYATARAAYEVTLEAFRSAGDLRGTAVALNGLGDVAAAQDAIADARRLYEDALEKFQQIGDLWGVAGVLRDLGDLACREGAHSSASSLYKEALGAFHMLGHRRGIAVVLEHLAICATWNDCPDGALKLASAAAAMRENLGISLSSAERLEFDRCIQAARQKLSKAEQTTVWAEGRSMTADQILELDTGICADELKPTPGPLYPGQRIKSGFPEKPHPAQPFPSGTVIPS